MSSAMATQTATLHTSQGDITLVLFGNHAPKTVAEYKAAHGPGCGCCSTGKKKPARLMTQSKSGAKGFPTARPWMISH